MRNALIASMATAALLAAACTHTSQTARSAFTGALVGAHVATTITDRTKFASYKH